MAYKYKIRSVDTVDGSFVVEFEGLQPLNFWIPHDENGWLTGDALDQAIQKLYPWEFLQKEKFKTFANGSALQQLVEPLPTPTPTAEQVRQQRDMLLMRSDWTDLPNAPLTAEQKSAWATYRQALRDITKQAGFPTTVNWPVAP